MVAFPPKAAHSASTKPPENPSRGRLGPVASPRSDAPHAATALVWRLLVAALLPIRLRDVCRLLTRIVARIRSYDAKLDAAAPKQVDAFRQKHHDAWAAAA